VELLFSDVMLRGRIEHMLIIIMQKIINNKLKNCQKQTGALLPLLSARTTAFCFSKDGKVSLVTLSLKYKITGMKM
jgi:hypothetical protein